MNSQYFLYVIESICTAALCQALFAKFAIVAFTYVYDLLFECCELHQIWKYPKISNFLQFESHSSKSFKARAISDLRDLYGNKIQGLTSLNPNFCNLYDWFLGEKYWYHSKDPVQISMYVLSNCRKLLILWCSFTWCKLFTLLMFVFDKNKDTPFCIGSAPVPFWPC